VIEWATMAEVARLFGWSESYARKLAHRDGITQPEGVDVDRPTVGSVQILRGNALALALADESVDLIVTSPPYFGLRSYQDGGEHYEGQIGDEATPAEFVDALIAATREMVRVVKPSGSIWVNLGDKYVADNRGSGSDFKRGAAKWAPAGPAGYPGEGVMPRKTLSVSVARASVAPWTHHPTGRSRRGSTNCRQRADPARQRTGAGSGG
jgi:hypothetical protein